MAWEIHFAKVAAPDLELFDDLDALTACLMRWVETGPPGTLKRRARAAGYEHGVPFWEDRTEEGILVQYLVGTQPVLFVEILSVRPPPKHPPSS